MRIAVGKRTLRKLSKRVSSLSSLRCAHPVLEAPVPAVRARRLFFDNEGFSTVGMVLALLITLSLVFTSGQVYRVQAASASVQNAADAAALAAEGPVAEFYVVVRVCDAVVLSLTLTGVAATGIGLVATCVPPLAALGAKLVEAGRTVFTARDSFATKATDALNKVQRALPYLSAAEAISVLRANSEVRPAPTTLGLRCCCRKRARGFQSAEKERPKMRFPRWSRSRKAWRTLLRALRKRRRRQTPRRRRTRYLRVILHVRACFGACRDVTGLRIRSTRAWMHGVSRLRLSVHGPTTNSAERKRRPRAIRLKSKRARRCVPGSTTLPSGNWRKDMCARRKLRSRLTFLSCRAILQKCARRRCTRTASILSSNRAECGLCTRGVGAPKPWAQLRKARFRIWKQAVFHLSLLPFAASSLGKVAAASTSIANGFEHHYAKVAEAARAYQKGTGGVRSA